MKLYSLKKYCILFLFMLFVSMIPLSVMAVFPAQETDLGYDPREANLDSQGMLWISHYLEGEIWQVDTQTGGIVSFEVGGGPWDGRGDDAGMLWWADVDTERLNRLETSSNTVHSWEIPASLQTTAIDAAGQVWATAINSPWVYRLDPATNNLCSYEIPDGGKALYLAPDGATLWFGDYANARVVHLDPDANTLDWWELPDNNSFPFGVGLDQGGNLWFTDNGLNQIGRVNPLEDKLTAYELPPDHSTPKMLSLAADGIWFSFEFPGGIGRLDPSAAESTDHVLVKETRPVAPTCEMVEPTSTGTITSRSFDAAWDEVIYPVLHDTAGLLTLQLPEDSIPYGIATGDAHIWLVDYGRSKLTRLSYPINVTACKWKDADGTLDTSDDQTPVTDWPLYLRIDGERQTPGKLTGPDGCAYWDVPLGQYSYGVEEDAAESWVALTETSHDFGLLQIGQVYSHTFINHQEGSLIYLPLILK